MIKEMNEKDQVDESRVSGLNVNVENLHMNVSMQHRTVIGLVEDRKSKPNPKKTSKLIKNMKLPFIQNKF